jgi:hypothetical protein
MGGFMDGWMGGIERSRCKRRAAAGLRHSRAPSVGMSNVEWGAMGESGKGRHSMNFDEFRVFFLKNQRDGGFNRGRRRNLKLET